MILICTLFGLWCATPQRLYFCPQPDITARELSLLLKGVWQLKIVEKYPELRRHTSEKECPE